MTDVGKLCAVFPALSGVTLWLLGASHTNSPEMTLKRRSIPKVTPLQTALKDHSGFRTLWTLAQLALHPTCYFLFLTGPENSYVATHLPSSQSWPLRDPVCSNTCPQPGQARSTYRPVTLRDFWNLKAQALLTRFHLPPLRVVHMDELQENPQPSNSLACHQFDIIPGGRILVRLVIQSLVQPFNIFLKNSLLLYGPD